jgi:hypothetical protein
MGFRRLRRTALAVLFACAIASSAWADPSASEKETARAMMDEGHARREAGDHVAALAQFRGADAIMHVPTTGLEVAREQIAIGQFVEARDTLERVIRSASTPNEPDAFRAARKAADALDQEVAPRIPSLRITETGAPSDEGLVVTVDGANIPVAALIAPIKVNPGHHVVSASANGLTARKEIEVAEAQIAAVTLALAPPTGPTSPAPGGDPTPAKATSTASSSATVSSLRWGGVGLVGWGRSSVP